MRTDIDLSTFTETVAASAADVFKECGEVLPMAHAITRNGETLIIGCPWGDENEKIKVIKALRELFRQADVTRYALITEAWTLMGGAAERYAKAGMPGAVSEQEDRRECLYVQAEDASGENISHVQFILRPEHGKPTLSAPVVNHCDSGQSEGRLSGLLGRPAASH